MKRGSSLRLRRPKPIGRSWVGLGRFSMTAISGLLSRRGLVLGGPAGRRHDVLVARAAADAAGDRGADLMLGGVRILVEQGADGHLHARRAEPALQRVQLVETLLDGIEPAV